MYPAYRQIDPGSLATRSREPISLRRLLPTASFVGCVDIRIVGATDRAEECTPGMLFVSHGPTAEDHLHRASDAVRRGASALLVSQPIAGLAVSQCVVPQVGRAYGQICASLVGRPMRSVRSVAVAGTADTSEVSWLIHSILSHAGHSAGLLTQEYQCDHPTPINEFQGGPCAKSFWDWMAQIRQQGRRFATVEVRDGLLETDWIAGSELEVAGITQLDPPVDATVEQIEHQLANCAQLLAMPRPGGTVLINQDDPLIGELRNRIPCHVDVVTFGLNRPAAFTASGIVKTPLGTRFSLAIRGNRQEIATRWAGTHHVRNCLMAAAAVDALGLSHDEIRAGLIATHSPYRRERSAS